MRAGARIVMAAAALSAAATAASAAPAVDWGPNQRLDTNADAFSPVFAGMSLRDDAIVGWTRAGGAGKAIARRRAGPHGQWSPPIDLGGGTMAGLAMSRSGGALALVTSGTTVRSARIGTAGGVTPAPLGTAGTAQQVLGAALRGDGTAVALVLRPGGTAVRLLTQAAPGGSWTASGPDLPVPPDSDLTAAMSRGGQAVVAWRAGPSAIAAATRPNLGGQWRSFPALPSDVPAGPSFISPIAVIGDDGSAAVTWIALGPSFDDSFGAGAFIPAGMTSTPAPLPIAGARVGIGVSPTGTAMMTWTDPALAGDLFASRFSTVNASWPIGIRRLAKGTTLDEGTFALAARTARRGPVIVEATNETGPGPDGQVAFGRPLRGKPFGKARPLPFSRGTPALAAGERAALVAIAVDDTAELIVAAYGRLPG
jgi:hypothetical protein